MDNVPDNNKREEKLIWSILDGVMDPEIPVLSITDLGIVRNVRMIARDEVHIDYTSTYSGCPAMDVISMNVKMALLSHGYTGIHLHQVLSPAWTTDWITERGKQRLKEYGIAPPSGSGNREKVLFEKADAVQCPRCGSESTRLISEFGSTACKSLYVCNNCSEPFDAFKCH